MRAVFKHLTLFIYGGILYGLCECLWRGHTYPSMFVLGGLCFVLLGGINEHLSFDMHLTLQALIGAGIVLSLEFIFGVVLNLWLKLGVWDYSALPFNLLGQICLYFAFAWYALSFVAIIFDDFLRYWLFGEERPHYKF